MWKQYNTGTFDYIQYTVQDSTEDVLDLAHYSTHNAIGNIEGTSAYDHRIYVAKVDYSWGNQRKSLR